MEYLEVTENIGASHNRLRTALSFWGSIECTFCKSKLVDVKSDPILLCCLHAACKPCIQKNASDNCVTCASCKQECQLHRVLHHRFVVDFKEDASNKNSEIKHIACSCADRSDCSSYCKYCQEWLCDACVLAHRRVTLTRNHFIKSKEEVLKMYPSRKVQFFRCPMHSLEILTLYCESCEQFACRVCRLVEHRDHMCRYLSSVSEQYKLFAMTTLREYEMVRENYSSCIRNAQQWLQNRQTYVINREVELMTEIQEFVQEMSMLISRRGEQLQQELHDACEQQKSPIASLNYDLGKLMAKVEHVLKFTESAVKNGSESALFYTKKLIEKQLGDLLSQQINVINPEYVVDIRFMYDSKYLSAYIEHAVQIIVDPPPNGVGSNNGFTIPATPNQYTPNTQQTILEAFLNRGKPRRLLSPHIMNPNYASISQSAQNNYVLAIPAHQFLKMNMPYVPRTQNMDPNLIQPISNPIQPISNPRPIAPLNQCQATLQGAQQTNNTPQQTPENGVPTVNVQRQNNCSTEADQDTNPHDSVTSTSENQSSSNRNVSLSVNDSQRLTYCSKNSLQQGHYNSISQSAQNNCVLAIPAHQFLKMNMPYVPRTQNVYPNLIQPIQNPRPIAPLNQSQATLQGAQPTNYTPQKTPENNVTTVNVQSLNKCSTAADQDATPYDSVTSTPENLSSPNRNLSVSMNDSQRLTYCSTNSLQQGHSNPRDQPSIHILPKKDHFDETIDSTVPESCCLRSVPSTNTATDLGDFETVEKERAESLEKERKASEALTQLREYLKATIGLHYFKNP